MSLIEADPDDIDAGEFVLGTLEPLLAMQMEARIPRDPALAARVARWLDRLEPLTLMLEEQAPPAAVWPRVQASIAAETSSSPFAARPVPRPWWKSGRFWGGFSLGTSVAAVTLAAAISVIGLKPQQGEKRLAVLQAKEAPAAGWLVETQDGRVVLTALAPPAIEPDQAYELWLIAPGAKAPASLGLVPGHGRVELPGRLFPDGSQLAISIEPSSGSPTGAPTGPVIAAGAVVRPL